MLKRITDWATLHRAVTYCIITFVLSWGYWFAVVYPLAFSGEVLGQSTSMQLAVGASMFFPAISVVLTRLITREGFKNAWIRPQAFRKTWKYYVVGWLGPIVLIAVGAALFFVLFPNEFDLDMSFYMGTVTAQLEAVGQPTLDVETMRLMAFAQMSLVLIAPLLNFITCFGEEWGWRGYLLPKMMERHSLGRTILLSGIIWGVWHAPITALGHNYGLEYFGYPVTGILAMCCFCIACGSFFSWLTLRTKSCIPAVFAHGALNGAAAAPSIFLATAANPFVGPAATGVIGGIGFIVVGIVCYLSLRRD